MQHIVTTGKIFSLVSSQFLLSQSNRVWSVHGFSDFDGAKSKWDK
jgi:hypothetical protein